MLTSWKTTLAGALAALGTYLATVDGPPWVVALGKFLAVVSPLALGLAARDNNRTSEDVGAATPRPVPGRSLPLLAFALLGICLVGCAHVHQEAKRTTTNFDREGKVTSVVDELAKSTINASGDAKLAVESARASTGKTLSVGAKGANEETTSDAIDKIGALVLKGMLAGSGGGAALAAGQSIATPLPVNQSPSPAPLSQTVTKPPLLQSGATYFGQTNCPDGTTNCFTK
jgi:hypothetical protein